ncbi:metal-dependent hydrolase [Liquorilactobacillus sucicola DSM 21376 = JCM 15457]|nr:metal-dependent hydrolase [Liquorilactobacillus sucicola DSM 21376 = JCM 15457]
MMKITILGFFGGYPYDGKATSSYLLQSDGYNLLLDCGSGALLNLEKELDPLQLNAVLLSHYHQDHIADIGVLQYYWQLNNEQIGGKFANIWAYAR